MAKSNVKLNDRVSRCFVPMITVVEDWELQYDENHNVDKVKVGETDLLKECASHKDEVGLINAIKYAIAHGDDVMTKFAKTEPGVSKAIDPNTTFDDLKGFLDGVNAKYEEIAKSLGLTGAELKAAISDGSIGSVIANASKPADTVTEGSDE